MGMENAPGWKDTILNTSLLTHPIPSLLLLLQKLTGVRGKVLEHLRSGRLAGPVADAPQCHVPEVCLTKRAAELAFQSKIEPTHIYRQPN